MAHLVWEAIGNTPNYIEPFAGSLATLLLRPHPPGTETVNDADGFIANFWRALAADPEAVEHWADWPVNECDLHARHAWLTPKRSELTERLMGNPEFYDAKIAGFWVWGICAWIGGGWCSGDGPWRVTDGKLLKAGNGEGIKKRRPHIAGAGRGINRKTPYPGDDSGSISTYLKALSSRLRRVRVTCGDWSRVTGPAVTHGLTGMLLDPPYDITERDRGIYSIETDCAEDVRRWAIENGDNPKIRIVLCGYEGQEMPKEWTPVKWKAQGGYAVRSDKRGKNNATRETLWLSPHCLSNDPGLLGQTTNTNNPKPMRY